MKKNQNSGMIFFGVAFEMVGLVIGGFVIGGMIDDFYGWKGGYAQIGLVLTLLLGWFIHLIYLIRRFEKNNPDEYS